jgi:hypothetical protein
MPEGGTGFEKIEKIEKPLGLLPEAASAPGGDTPEYVLETCDAGMCPYGISSIIVHYFHRSASAYTRLGTSQVGEERVPAHPLCVYIPHD